MSRYGGGRVVPTPEGSAADVREMIRLPLRRTPPLVAAEAQMLAAWLEWHRATLVHMAHGSGDPDLAALLRHMTDLEVWWFQAVFAGRADAPRYATGDDLEAAFVDLTEIMVADSLEAFEAACAESRRVAAGVHLDDVAAHPQVRSSLRWVMIHLIEEYARHTGAAAFTECG